MLTACALSPFVLATPGQMRQMPETTQELSAAEQLRPVVRALVAHLLGEGRRHPDVEDCTHEALRRALEGRARLRPGEPLRPWVLGIARHVALDLLRSRRRAKIASLPAGDEGGAEPLERIPDSKPGADVELERAERIQRVRSAMQRLPGDQRRALELFHLDGLGYREIAQAMGVPIGTVGTWVARGRRAIAAALEGAEP
jgi:RNA polymerase sigma factor (sigma-70 family)